ncbi:hypothetical protein L3Q82_000374 [Scortum barcoo]|uniref:Uncharacterized protein n=1 Tax=Scortum barcoo TaxID=214431 RepID=A0ACB8XAM4_9TELE|nr:hypothetical protein L3Q82_000374 [Scortum barcoo]
MERQDDGDGPVGVLRKHSSAEEPVDFLELHNKKLLGSQNAKLDVLSRLYEPELADKEPEPILPLDCVVEWSPGK